VISQPDPGSPTYVIADKDGNELRLHAQHLAKFVAYANDRELSDAKHVPASLDSVMELYAHATRPVEDKEAKAVDGSMDASDARNRFQQWLALLQLYPES